MEPAVGRTESYSAVIIRNWVGLHIRAAFRRKIARGNRPCCAGLKNPYRGVNLPAMSKPPRRRESYEAAVVGGGRVVFACAIARAEAGCRTALIARRLPYGDNRT